VGAFIEAGEAGFSGGEGKVGVFALRIGVGEVHAVVFHDAEAEERHRRAVHGELAELHGFL